MTWTENVWQAVEAFRTKHSCEELEKIPIDPLTVAELNVGLNIIPFPDLQMRYPNVAAALTADFSGIYIDEEEINGLERLPYWKMNRLQFSIAHELGHLELHKEEFLASGFQDLSSFYDWSQSLGGEKYRIEQEANEFAGRLLVPRDRLQDAFDQACPNLETLGNWRSSNEIRDLFAGNVCQQFRVHQRTILTRLDREGIWPDPSR